MRRPCIGVGAVAVALAAAAGGACAQADPHAGLVGSEATRFSLPGLRGESVRFPRFDPATRLNVLVFWATWNRFCAQELAELGRHRSRWAKVGVRVVAVNVESSRIDAAARRAIAAWVREHGLPFEVAVDAELGAFRAYGVVAVPTTLVVDETGRIVVRLAGYPIGGARRLLGFVEARIVESQDVRARTPGRRRDLGYRRAMRHLRLGRVLIRKHQVDLAEYTLEQALREDPTLVDAWLELERLHVARGDTARARSVLDQVRARFPRDASVLLEQARMALAERRVAAAEKLALEALAVNPALASSRTTLGRIRLARGDRAGALSFFLDAARQNPLAAGPRIEAARIFEARGETARALELYERAYDLPDIDLQRTDPGGSEKGTRR